MAFLIPNISFPEAAKVTTVIRCVLICILRYVYKIINSLPYSSSQESGDVSEYARSPSQVPVPHNFILTSIKERLPVIEYHCIQHRVLGSVDGNCAICLMAMEGCDEVRELANCSHVFHRDCIDAWIDKSRISCPLCRSNLVLEQGEQEKSGQDPWRRERMMYLFGADYEFFTS